MYLIFIYYVCKSKLYSNTYKHYNLYFEHKYTNKKTPIEFPL